MRKVGIILSVLTLIAMTVSAQDTLTISTLRMGPFKLEVKKTEVEQILGKQLTFNKKLTYKDKYGTRINIDVLYNSISITMSFLFEPDTDDQDSLQLIYMSTKDPRVRTLSGLGIGSSKTDLLNAFSDKYNINLYFLYKYNKFTGKTERDTQKRIFSILDNDAGTQLQFILQNNIVTEIIVCRSDEDSGD